MDTKIINIKNLIYKKIINFSKAKNAWKYLSFISFIESIVFPIPTDVFLAPLILARKNKTFFYIFITIFFSVLGGIAGYLIGFYFWEHFSSKIIFLLPAFNENFLKFKVNFNEFGWFIVLIGGFTPIPYKIITISSGILGLDLILFIVCSIISRSARFIFVGYMFYKFGENIKLIIEKYINYISIILIILFFIYVILI